MYKDTVNLFDIATKELSQDAFLMWLLRSFNSKNEMVSKVSYDFINFLLNDFTINYGDIIEVKTWAQWKRIDVLAEIRTKDKKNIVIAIEDKTFSGEHNQLEDYTDEISKYYLEKLESENWIVKTIFYKTDLKRVNDHDINACKESSNKYICWEYYFIEEIYDFFKKYDVTDSEILDSYISHIKNLYVDLTTISSKNMKDWNLTNFATYFREKFIFPKENSKDIKYELWVYRGIYPMLAIHKKLNNRTRFSFQVSTRLYDEGASVGIFTVDIDKDKNEKETNRDLKTILKNYISDNPFIDNDSNNEQIKIVNHKNEIARNSEDLQNKLSYAVNIDDFTKTIEDLISWFEGLLSKDLNQIIKEHNIKEYKEPNSFKYLIIKVKNETLDHFKGKNDPRYLATRSCWSLNKNRINDYRYVFSVSNGIVRDIYYVDEWIKLDNGKYEFNGAPASNNKRAGFIKREYINKRIPSYYSKKGMSNPVLYSKN